jgi:hypothetical protein
MGTYGVIAANPLSIIRQYIERNAGRLTRPERAGLRSQSFTA